MSLSLAFCQGTKDSLTLNGESNVVTDVAAGCTVVGATLVHVVAKTRHVAETERGTGYQRNVT